MNHSEQFSAFSRPKTDFSRRHNADTSFAPQRNTIPSAGRMSLDFLLNDNNNTNHNLHNTTSTEREPESVFFRPKAALTPAGICIPQPILPKPPQLGTTTLPSLLPMVVPGFAPTALYTTTTTTTTTTTSPVTPISQDAATQQQQGFTSHATSMLGKRKQHPQQQDHHLPATTATRSTRVESPAIRFHYETSHRFSPIQSTSKTTLALTCENPASLADTTTTATTNANKKIKLNHEKKEPQIKKIKKESESSASEEDECDPKDGSEEGGASGKVKKRRRRLTTHELFVLESYFAANNSPDSLDKVKLAGALNMTPQQINNWFQNKRSRVRRDKQAGQKNSVQAAAALQAFGLLAGLTTPNSTFAS